MNDLIYLREAASAVDHADGINMKHYTHMTWRARNLRSSSTPDQVVGYGLIMESRGDVPCPLMEAHRTRTLLTLLGQYGSSHHRGGGYMEQRWQSKKRERAKPIPSFCPLI